MVGSVWLVEVKKSLWYLPPMLRVDSKVIQDYPRCPCFSSLPLFLSFSSFIVSYRIVQMGGALPSMRMTVKMKMTPVINHPDAGLSVLEPNADPEIDSLLIVPSLPFTILSSYCIVNREIVYSEQTLN